MEKLVEWLCAAVCLIGILLLFNSHTMLLGFLICLLAIIPDGIIQKRKHDRKLAAKINEMIEKKLR